MLLIVLGSLAAMSLATLILTALCRAGVPSGDVLERATRDPSAIDRDFGSWEEIALRTARRHPLRSTTALRRRHLAAVLPADARR